MRKIRVKWSVSVFGLLLILGGAGIWHRAHSKHAGGTEVAVKRALYRCPMHPTITSDHPGICPVCHMNLEKVDDEPAAGASAPQSGLDDHAGFALSEQKQQLIGVTTGEAKFIDLTREIRATGHVAYDPELFTALEDYRQAQLAYREIADSPYPELKEQSLALVNSSRVRLRLLGLSDSQIQSLSTKGSDSMNLILPKGKVWVYADVYEYEVGNIRSGETVEATVPSAPGKVFEGKVSSISPILDESSRTVRIRALVPDPAGILRPDTFVNVKIKVNEGRKLCVPEDAVMHSGDLHFVFLAKQQGHFDPVQVEVGAKTRDYYEILSGVKVGERVVTAANFLMDSESRLRAAIQQMARGR